MPGKYKSVKKSKQSSSFYLIIGIVVIILGALFYFYNTLQNINLTNRGSAQEIKTQSASSYSGSICVTPQPESQYSGPPSLMKCGLPEVLYYAGDNIQARRIEPCLQSQYCLINQFGATRCGNEPGEINILQRIQNYTPRFIQNENLFVGQIYEVSYVEFPEALFSVSKQVDLSCTADELLRSTKDVDYALKNQYKYTYVDDKKSGGFVDWRVRKPFKFLSPTFYPAEP